MTTLKFHFQRRDTLVNTVIRWFTQSKVNHVSIQLGDKNYEADYGKVFDTYPLRLKNVYRTYEFQISEGQARIIENYLQGWVGAKYDLYAFFGFFLNKKKQNSTRLYCVEPAEFILNLLFEGLTNPNRRLTTPGGLMLGLEYLFKGLNMSNNLSCRAVNIRVGKLALR